MTRTARAVLARWSDSHELFGIACDLCAAATVAHLTGNVLLFSRLVDQAAGVLELRKAAGEEAELDE